MLRFAQASQVQRSQAFMPIQSMSFARVSRARAKNTIGYELRKAGSIEAYFEKLMRRRHTSETGVIDMPRRNLEDVIKGHVHTEEDYK